MLHASNASYIKNYSGHPSPFQEDRDLRGHQTKPTRTFGGLGKGGNHLFLPRFYSADHDEYDKLVVGKVEKNQGCGGQVILRCPRRKSIN